jgi:hypothetical protein
MKHLALRLTVALFTFLLGVLVASVWIVKPRSTVVKPATDCVAVYDPNLAAKSLREDDDPKVFAAFKELPLEALPACVEESYRLMWFPTFHSPVVVRVWRSGGKYFLVSKKLSGLGGYEIGDLDIERARPLSENEWFEFMNVVNRASYWELPSTTSEAIPEDGAVWMVEGLRNGRYHWVRRVTPLDQYTVLCKHLIGLSGLKTSHEKYLPRSSVQ